MTRSVLLVNSWRVVEAKGGTEKVFCDLANALTERGFSVTMLCCDSKKGQPGFSLRKEVKFVNVGCVSGKWWRLLVKLKSISWSSESRKRRRGLVKVEMLSRALKKALPLFDEADVIISFQPETTYIIKERLKVKAPLVSMFHHDPKVYFLDSLFYLYKKSLLQCDVLQVLRPEFKESLFGIGAENVICIPNACPRFRRKKNLSSKKIVFVGRVNIKQKRLDLLVKAFSLLKEVFPDWTLEIWGELGVNSHDARYIFQLIDQLNLKGCVFLRGVTDDVESVLRDSSIFAFPSASEGFGLSLIEAMMVGLPAVGCIDCSAVNTLIQDGVNGLLSKPDPESFAEALSKLMRDGEMRRGYGEEARKTAQKFDPNVVWEMWEDLIESVVSRQRC